MSLSINTNTSSMVALETLNATQTALSATENAVSTGKKVASAEDSPASYGIAAQMQGNISGQSAVNDGLTFTAKVVGTSSSAADKILSVLNDVQKAVTDLGNNDTSTTSLSQLSDELDGFFKEIDSIAGGATINGVNLLGSATLATTEAYTGMSKTGGSLAYVAGLSGQRSTINGFASMGTAAAKGGMYKDAFNSSGTSFSDMLNLKTSSFVTGGTKLAGTADSKQLISLVSLVQHAITNVTKFTSKLGAASQTISSLSSFGTNLSDNLTAGVGALTDADMSAESAKLTSLQTKQSLAIKSLTIANGQSQNILSLFQG
jgi:flagellin